MEIRNNPPRQPIPRPWLERRRDVLSERAMNEMDILGKPKWKLSWEKLRTCCRTGKSEVDHRVEVNRHPFSGIHALRRDSSRSFNSYDYYSSDGSGSVSSFTDSDNSSSYSDDSSSTSSIEPIPQQQLRYPQTPPLSYTPKPPMIAARSRSAGLPPLNPTFATPSPMQHTRNRCDTGDFTRTSVTTNSSRHRRLQQFQFSPQSLTNIWGDSGPGGTGQLPIKPPLFVQVPDEDEIHGSGYASSFDDSTHNHESWSIGTDLQSKDQPVIVDRKRLPPTNKKSHHRRPKGRKKGKEQPIMSTPVYLRKKVSLDNITSGNLVLSGWIAACFDSDISGSGLMKGARISFNDIYYMQIIDSTDSASIIFCDNDGTVVKSLILQKDWICESCEITCRIGKAVSIKSPTSTVASLLPISLDDSFFIGENLVSSLEFSQVKNKLFAIGQRYAPDEQHDSATYILFSLDALIKMRGK